MMGKASVRKRLRDEGEKRAILVSPKAGAGGIGKATVVLLLTIVLPLGIAAFERNSTWKGEIIMWEDVVENSAYKARGHNNLGFVYGKLSRVQEAIEEYQKAIRLKSDYADAYSNLGIAYVKLGRVDEAIT